MYKGDAYYGKIFLGYIYKITSQINGKVYIGQTSKIDPTKR